MIKSFVVAFVGLFVCVSLASADLCESGCHFSNANDSLFSSGNSGNNGPDRQFGTTSITHSLDTTTITAGNSVHCGFNDIHANNGYWRVFDLPTFGILDPFQVNSVDLGIEVAIAATPGLDIPGFLNFYLDPSGDDGLTTPGDLILLGSFAADTPDQTFLSVLNFPVGGPVAPVGSTMVVEFFTPGSDGPNPLGDTLFIGSNPNGETDDTFISAAACGVPDPVPTSAIGFPNMHWVLVVNGQVVPEPGSMGVLALAGLGVVSRRRRKKTVILLRLLSKKKAGI